MSKKNRDKRMRREAIWPMPRPIRYANPELVKKAASRTAKAYAGVFKILRENGD